ncbi:MAG: FHA domain-containing serine/threonine-protein kinase [Planctomycetota bacterium]
MPGLIVEKGPDKGTKVKLEPGKKLVVGREEGLPLQIHDITISRKHFRLDLIDSKIQLIDLDSRNGTYLNGARIESPQLCKPGDKIRIGETLFSIISDEEFYDPLLDKQIAGYLLGKRLGKGGMGTVYQSLQISLNRTVALKILSASAQTHHHLSNENLVQQFVKEAQAAAALSHPNIVQIYDVGSCLLNEKEIHYFSMEYCEQGSLQDILGKVGKIHWKESIPMILQAAQGLAYAERKKIVHRDIKPDNLMINEENILKIGDLGLAKNLEEYSAEESAIFGTAHFVSPEQIQGKSLDHRADLYSLGATIFRIITGETLFSGKVAREIIVKQISESPRDPHAIDPSIPEAFSKMVLRLLEKDPAKRYPSATLLISHLEQIEKTPDIRSSQIAQIALKPALARSHQIGGIVLIGLALCLTLWKLFFSAPPEDNTNSNEILASQQEEIARLRRKEQAQKILSDKMIEKDRFLRMKPLELARLESIYQEFQTFCADHLEFPDLVEKAGDQQHYLKNEIARYQFQQIQLQSQREEIPILEKIQKIQDFLTLYPENSIPKHPNFPISPRDEAQKLLNEIQQKQHDQEQAQQLSLKRLQNLKRIQDDFQLYLQKNEWSQAETFLNQQKNEFPEFVTPLQELFLKLKESIEKDFLRLKQTTDQMAEQQQFNEAIQLLEKSPLQSNPVYERRLTILITDYRQRALENQQSRLAQIKIEEEENFARVKAQIQPLIHFTQYEKAFACIQQDRYHYQTEIVLKEREQWFQHLQLLAHFKQQLLKAIAKPQTFSNPTIYLKGIFNFPKKTPFSIIGLDDEGRVLLQQNQSAGKVTLPAKWEDFPEKDLAFFLYLPKSPKEKERYRYKLEIQDQLSLIAFLFETRQFTLLSEEMDWFEKYYSEVAQGKIFKRYKELAVTEIQKEVEADEKRAIQLIEEIEDAQILKKTKQAKEMMEELKEKYSHTQAFKDFQEKQ